MKEGDGRPRGRVREGKALGKKEGAPDAPWESCVQQLTLQPNTVVAPQLLRCAAKGLCTTHAALRGPRVNGPRGAAAAVGLLHGDKTAAASGAENGSGRFSSSHLLHSSFFPGQSEIHVALNTDNTSVPPHPDLQEHWIYCWKFCHAPLRVICGTVEYGTLQKLHQQYNKCRDEKQQYFTST